MLSNGVKIKKFIFFHNKKHPKDMSEEEVKEFLTYLAVDRKVSASTQNQALSAILFLYKNVLKKELKFIKNTVSAKRHRHIPVVFSREEIEKIFNFLKETNWLIANLLYVPLEKFSNGIRFWFEIDGIPSVEGTRY